MANIDDYYSQGKGERKTFIIVACSRRTDSGAGAKNKASERAGKIRGLPSFFPALSLVFFFTRSALSERLEQAIIIANIRHLQLQGRQNTTTELCYFTFILKKNIDIIPDVLLLIRTS